MRARYKATQFTPSQIEWLNEQSDINLVNHYRSELKEIDRGDDKAHTVLTDSTRRNLTRKGILIRRGDKGRGSGLRSKLTSKANKILKELEGGENE